MPAATFDLDAYLERIGVSGRPSLAALHRAHVASIPFENLDPHRGVPISLELGALQRKLVTQRRGGYCFEHNLLLAAALRALGAEVDLLLGRVRLGRPAGRTSPRTHLVLRVRDGGDVWLADAGFGNGTLLEPIRFGPGATHDQAGWRFRLVANGPEHVLQTADGAGWTDLYAFVPEPVPNVDVETSNWFTSTHPRSPFVTGLIVSIQSRDGSRAMLSDWTGLKLTEERAGGSECTETAVVPEQIPALLEDRFGLPGFRLDGGGRVVLAGVR
ncbi:MAG TPA: arylamine N-acetyltransferase [Solirubrobacteraceae bacterium]